MSGRGVAREQALEPGLLRIFRIYVILRVWALLLVGIVLLGGRGLPVRPGYVVAAALYLGEPIFLYGYLHSAWLQRVLGGWYLPTALFVAAAAPIIQIRTVVGTTYGGPELATGMPQNLDFWLIFPFLTVPLILTAWQYNYRAVLLYSVGTTLFEVLVPRALALARVVRVWPDAGTLLARMIFMLAIGYIVTYLMAEQRLQRQELSKANRKLVRYATMREQLGMSRERNRLGRELHDTLAHTLSGLAVELDALASVWQPDELRARRLLDHALATTRDGLDETRRALQNLRAAPLEDLGLSLAVRNLAENAAERGALALVLEVARGLPNLPADVEQAYYRVAQEALENAIKHADARALTVKLQPSDGELLLTVEDDGRGFAAGEADDTAGELRFGLQGMRERAELIGGAFTVEATPGQGTRVTLRTPLADW